MPGHQTGPAATIAAFLVAASFPVAAVAADAPSAYDACMNAAQSTPDYAACSSAELQRLDRLLNEAWHRASEKLKSFDMHAFNLLLTEQRNWIKWKNSACLYYFEDFGSAGRSIQYPACFRKLVQDRVNDLNALADEP